MQVLFLSPPRANSPHLLRPVGSYFLGQERDKGFGGFLKQRPRAPIPRLARLLPLWRGGSRGCVAGSGSVTRAWHRPSLMRPHPRPRLCLWRWGPGPQGSVFCRVCRGSGAIFHSPDTRGRLGPSILPVPTGAVLFLPGPLCTKGSRSRPRILEAAPGLPPGSF